MMSLFLVNVVFSASVILLFLTVVEVSAYDGFSLNETMALSIGVFLLCVLIVVVAATAYWCWRKKRVEKRTIHRISEPLSDAQLEETMLKLNMATQESSSTDEDNTETVSIERETTPKYTMSHDAMSQDDQSEIPQNPTHLSVPETECDNSDRPSFSGRVDSIGAATNNRDRPRFVDRVAPIEKSDVLQHAADKGVADDNDQAMSCISKILEDDAEYTVPVMPPAIDVLQDDPDYVITDNTDPVYEDPKMSSTHKLSQDCIAYDDNDEPIYDEFPQDDSDYYVNVYKHPVESVPVMIHANENSQDDSNYDVNEDDDPVYNVPKMSTTDENPQDDANYDVNENDDPVYDVPKISTSNEISQDDPDYDVNDDDDPVYDVPKMSIFNEISQDDLEINDPPLNRPTSHDSDTTNTESERNYTLREDKKKSPVEVDGTQSGDPGESNTGKETRDSGHSSGAGEINTGFHESNSSVSSNPDDGESIQQDILNQNTDKRDSGNMSESSEENEKTTSSGLKHTERKLQLVNQESTNSQDEASSGDEMSSYAKMFSPMDIQTREKNTRHKEKDGSSDWDSIYEEMSYN